MCTGVCWNVRCCNYNNNRASSGGCRSIIFKDRHAVPGHTCRTARARGRRGLCRTGVEWSHYDRVSPDEACALCELGPLIFGGGLTAETCDEAAREEPPADFWGGGSSDTEGEDDGVGGDEEDDADSDEGASLESEADSGGEERYDEDGDDDDDGEDGGAELKNPIDTMSTNPLSPTAILQRMADALPTHAHGDTTSDLSSSHEAIALFTHACMVALDFRLLGFDEDKIEEARCHELAPRLPPNWNASFNTYAFVYAHQQSALRFVIRVDRMGGKAEIRGLAVQDERIARLEIIIRDFVSNAALPVRITPARENDNAGGGPEEDRSDLCRKLRDVMISESRVADLAALIKINIIQKLLPSLQKEGYEEESPDDRAARDDADDFARRPPRQPAMPEPLPRPAQPYPFDDPLNPPPPRNPVPAGDFPPPGFEDPYDINRPPRGSGGGGIPQPGRTPFGNIGEDDLNPPPLGPHDPFRPGAGRWGGGLPRPGGGRGMHPTFDDPLFGGPGGGAGGDDFDPQVPPGARYDPLGPGGLPRLGGRGPGGNGGWPFGGGGGGGGFGGGII
ncbi:hypothetical protein DL771_003532 [Monosporascus sp. 5C6A]|nr:hypothetical protein DL771_003532 [Monosporascus sp. 5C6A]